MKDPLNISIDWIGKMQFTATNDKSTYKVAIDVPDIEVGGENKGTTPKLLFLQSIAGCTGQIIVMFLKKMKAEMPTKFKIDIKGELSSTHPMYFETIDITYHAEGNTDINKLKKVVKMSEEQYCGLTLMVSKMAKIKSVLVFNDQVIEL